MAFFIKLVCRSNNERNEIIIFTKRNIYLLCYSKINSMQFLTKIFLNNKIILTLIILNAIIIFAQEQIGSRIAILEAIDVAIIIFFVIEMCVKIKHYSFKNYIADNWNKLDFSLIIISIPCLLFLIINIDFADFTFFLAFRMLRLMRVVRTFRFLPDVNKTFAGFVRAIKISSPIFFAIAILIFIFSLINCALFGSLSPEYFSTPSDAIFSTFLIFTVEGWNEIPQSITENLTESLWMVNLIRLYFAFLLAVGGIIGLSLLNSVFVDAMVADNNDELNLIVSEMKNQIDVLNQKIDKLIEK